MTRPTMAEGKNNHNLLFCSWITWYWTTARNVYLQNIRMPMMTFWVTGTMTFDNQNPNQFILESRWTFVPKLEEIPSLRYRVHENGAGAVSHSWPHDTQPQRKKMRMLFWFCVDDAYTNIRNITSEDSCRFHAQAMFSDWAASQCTMKKMNHNCCGLTLLCINRHVYSNIELEKITLMLKWSFVVQNSFIDPLLDLPVDSSKPTEHKQTQTEISWWTESSTCTINITEIRVNVRLTIHSSCRQKQKCMWYCLKLKFLNFIVILL